MKKTNLIFLVSLTIFVAMISSSCLKEYVINRPADQPNTKWTSEDGIINFETDDGGAGFGTLKTSDKTIDIYFATGRARVIDIYSIDDAGNHALIERWYGNYSYIKEEQFTAVVSEKTTYYKKGQKIKFYRVDE